MSNLIICKQTIKRQGLKNLPIPTPPEGSRWAPLPYHQQADLALESLRNHGYDVHDEAHGIAKPALLDAEGNWVRVNYSDIKGPQSFNKKEGQPDSRLFWRQYFGGFALTHAAAIDARRSIVLGLRNSYDQSLAASLVVGNRMMVCENLCFGAEIKLTRKNTLNIKRDLPAMMDAAIAQIMGHYVNMGRRVAAYKEHLIDEATALYLLAHLVDIDSLSKKDIYDALLLFRNPTTGADSMVDKNAFETEDAFKSALSDKRDEFREEFGTLTGGKGTLWNLYNAFTFVLKGTSLDDLPQRTMTAQAYFDSIAGFTPPPVAVDLVEVDATPDEQTESAAESFGASADLDAE